MGSRLGVVVLSDSGYELYYDHWAAQTIGIDIVVDGVAATLERVRGMQPMGIDTPAEWSGASWIEGSLLIDLTRKRVVWAEESDYVYLPRIVNHLVEHTWPGWTAIWSAEGVRGILRLAEVDPATIFPVAPVSQRPAENVKWLAPWSEHEGYGALSVQFEDGGVIAWRSSCFLDEVAELGPAAIRSVAEETQARGAAGEPVLWDRQPRGEHPDLGVHVNFGTKTARWWGLGDNDVQIDAFDALWPGWSVETVGDAFELHEAIVGRQMRDWAADVVATQRIIQTMMQKGPRENPMIHLAALMADQGETIEINSSALRFKAASDFRGAQAAVSALDDLYASQPLPPARIVNRHGRIFIPELGQV
ncbi:hypothetical protein A5666_20625 [Mycolicibacterium fortuitum]|uniref:Uncharacterized protein n=1 Tax=Mycolicibacterium fortuitum TaxID=1766 RepID=A0ABD6QHJ5_MYCFO|nr:hypothetical protein [Mycolicibacterium fortuitum]OBA92758.1 hypothetical protein A5665_11355 [Mycolicibacterium fortuitum]OBI71644.1 hypothetical protein A5666_20625 [Mycolicibacterium fortuitum]OMC38684.1 hypothetical protein A5742_06940 [Mycolicibacterium fortuitum]